MNKINLLIYYLQKFFNFLYKKIKFLFKVNYEAIYNLIKYDGVEHAGYMSFMILLSLFPFVIFFLEFTSVLGAHYIGKNFIEILLVNLPSNLIVGIESQLRKIYVLPPQKILNLAILGLIWTSSSFIESIRTILNKIYHVKTPPSYILRRLLSIAQFFFLTIGIFLFMLLWLGATIGSIVIKPLSPEVIMHFTDMINNLITLMPKLNIILTLLSKQYYSYLASFVLFLFTSLLYYMIPNVKIQVKEIIPGSIVVVSLWILCANILSKYLSSYTQLDIIYGSLGSIIVILLFFYIVSIIFVYGAALNFAIKQNLK